jgi:hypothetical protein
VNDLDRLRTAAEAADGVIHGAFNATFKASAGDNFCLRGSGGRS